MNNKNFLITILMAALSLILLFSVSCSLDDKTGGGGVSPTSPEADSGGSGTGTESGTGGGSGTGSGGGSGTGTEGGGSGTGSTPGAGDALVNSVPSPKGEPIGEGDALYYKDSGKEYSLTLTFSESDSDLANVGNYFTDYELDKSDTSFTLGITNGLVTFNVKREEGSGLGTSQTIFSNAQLKYDSSSGKYQAGSEESDGEGNISFSSKNYMEFKKGEGDNLTDFKYIAAASVNGSYTDDEGNTTSFDGNRIKMVFEQK